MSAFSTSPQNGEGTDAPQLAAYNQAAGLISSLADTTHQPHNFSPSLDLLTQSGLQSLAGQPQQQSQQSVHSAGAGLSFGGLGAGLRSSGPFGERKMEPPGQKQLCTFFLRTGTCAYGDRCKFSHPADRPPPQLNSRGYPVRAEEPDCAHYLKKGWCAFGPTCKYNHPEIVGGLSSYSLSQPPTAYVSLPTTTFPSATVYSMPSAVPTLYYLPPGMGPNQLAGSTVSLLPSTVGGMAAAQPNQMAFTQQSALGGAAPATMYRQPAAASPYGGMGGMGGGMGGMGGMGGGIGGGMGGMGGAGMGGGMGNMGGMGATSVSALHEAFQGLALGRSSGGLGGRKQNQHML